MRKSLALGVVGAMTTGLAALVPATAANAACSGTQIPACTGGTPVTATVGITGVGIVSIAVPSAAVLTQAGSTLSGPLTLTTVTDTRTASGSWAVTANMSDLTLANTSTTIPAATNASMCAGTVSLLVPLTATVTNHADCATPTYLPLTNIDATLLNATTSNANTVTYLGTLKFNVPAGTPMGLYTGTLTQTVS